MMWWILAGISAWAIIVFWVICLLRMAALSDRRDEEAVRASRQHSDRFPRERAGEPDELEQAWQRPRERSGGQDRW
jgi:type VI protein secretion system component VasK